MAVRVEVVLTDGWFAGETKELAFPVKDDAGVPVDVSSWDAKWVLKRSANSARHLLEKSTTLSSEITVAAGPESVMNVFVVQVSAQEAAAVLRTGVELYQELKRMDIEGVLSYGPVMLNYSGIPVEP